MDYMGDGWGNLGLLTQMGGSTCQYSFVLNVLYLVSVFSGNGLQI